MPQNRPNHAATTQTIGQPTPCTQPPKKRKFTHFTAICFQPMQKMLDDTHNKAQNNRIALNHAIGFSSLKTTRQTSRPSVPACLAHQRTQSGIFMVCVPLTLPFYGKQGAGDLVSVGTCCQSANLPFVSRLAFSSVSGLIKPNTKRQTYHVSIYP